MMEKAQLHLFDRILGWVLPAIAALTPFFIVYTLVRPNTGQAYFFQMVVLAATTVVGIALLAGWRALPRRFTLPAWLILMIVLSFCGSLEASRDKIFSIKQALLPACGFAFFWLIVSHPRRDLLLGRIRAVLVILGTLLSLYGIAQHFGFEILHYSAQVEKNKVIATIGHPNYLASVLGPVLFIVLSFVFSRQGFLWKLINILIIFSILFCITLGLTRGVWLGLVLGLICIMAIGSLYCIRHRNNLRWMGGIAIGTVLLLAGLATMVFGYLPAVKKGIDLRERIISDKEIKSRGFYWRAAIDMTLEKPAFGQGYGMFDPGFWDYTLKQQQSAIGPFYYDILSSISGNSPGHVHNEYLEVLAEQGFAGFTALVALLTFFALYGYWSIMAQGDPRQALQCVAFLGALTTILTDAFFGFPWRLPVSLIVFMFVLAWIYNSIYPQRPADQEWSDLKA